MAWLFSVSICQPGEPGSYTPGLWDRRWNKRKKEGRYSPLIQGEERGGRNPTHLPACTKSDCQRSGCELLGASPTRARCNEASCKVRRGVRAAMSSSAASASAPRPPPIPFGNRPRGLCLFQSQEQMLANAKVLNVGQPIPTCPTRHWREYYSKWMMSSIQRLLT